MFQGHNSFNKNCRCTFVLSSYAEDNILKVPKCEIFDPFFLTPINCAWVGNLRTGEKKNLGEDYGRYLPFCVFCAHAEPALKNCLRRLSVR